MRRRRGGRLGLNHDNLLTAVAAPDKRPFANGENHDAAASLIARWCHSMMPRDTHKWRDGTTKGLRGEMAGFYSFLLNGHSFDSGGLSNAGALGTLVAPLGCGTAVVNGITWG